MLVIQYTNEEDVSVSPQTESLTELITNLLEDTDNLKISIQPKAIATVECRGLPDSLVPFRAKTEDKPSFIKGWSGELLYNFPAVRIEVETQDGLLDELEVLDNYTEEQESDIVRYVI